MAATRKDLPDDIDALRAALIAERAKRIDEAARAARVEAELAVAKAKASDDAAVIAHGTPIGRSTSTTRPAPNRQKLIIPRLSQDPG
jgi:hypothetical protein